MAGARKHSVKPWDDLEFGTSALPAPTPSSPGPKSSEPNHLEHAEKKESFWDALKAESSSIPATTDGRQIVNEKSAQDASNEVRRWSVTGMDLPRINSAALAAAQSEHRMSFRDGLRLFPKAIFWSAVISLAIVGEGFDTALVNSLYAFETFQRAYGVKAPDGSYQITANWQTILSNSGAAVTIIGLLVNGWLSERFGYRRTLMFALAALAAFIFLTFFAFNIHTLLAGQILLALPWGICSTLTMSYAAEVMPLALRGYLIANVNMCWVIGQIIALAVLRALLDTNSQWSYRIPFGLQWVWVVIVFVGAFLAPESPWWLVRNGRIDEARGVLIRLAQKDQSFNADNVIAMMQHTDEVEKQLNNGQTQRNDLSYFECFRGTNRRRTEVACMVFMIQNLSGLPLIAFAAYFYRNIGFDIKTSFNITLGMHGLAIIACLLSLVLIRHFGRRQIYLCGLAACFTVLLVASTIGSFAETQATLWGQATMVICMIFVFDLTVGPVTYSLVAEMPSTRLRVNTVVLARVSYNLCAIVTNAINTRALNPLAWNLHGKANWIWTGACLVCFVYCWFRLPETKGLTYHELDILFEKRAPARKFGSIQKKLDETGYFELYDQRPSVAEQAAWR